MAKMEQMSEGGIDQIGDYLLLELLSESERTQSFRAEQVSVKRMVVLDRLRSQFAGDETVVEAFLEDLKVKAQVAHSGVGLVYEALRESGHVFFTKEVILGESLESMESTQRHLKPEEWIGVIRQLAETAIYYEDHSIATMPMAPHHVFVDERMHARVVNLAIQGESDPHVATQDKQMLGMVVGDLIREGFPATTRLKSLCEYMSDMNRAEPLSWDQIHRLCLQVEDELDQAHSVLIEAAEEKGKDSRKMLLFLVGGGVALVALFLGASQLFSSDEASIKVEEARDLSQMVSIKAGTYRSPDGMKVKLEEFWIDAHEVTIHEYALFLKDLRESDRAGVDHPDQPKGKATHEPSEWAALYGAAQDGSFWNGMKVTLNSPVVNVDWWDAYAYAKWLGRSLPSQEEFLAAAQAMGGNPGALLPSDWGEVDHSNKDLSLSGVYGLSGNVREWMGEPALNPAFPMGEPLTVICGGSYLNGGSGVKTRTWEERKNRRGIDLGFRTVSSRAPRD